MKKTFKERLQNFGNSKFMGFVKGAVLPVAENLPITGGPINLVRSVVGLGKSKNLVDIAEVAKSDTITKEGEGSKMKIGWSYIVGAIFLSFIINGIAKAVWQIDEFIPISYLINVLISFVS